MAKAKIPKSLGKRLKITKRGKVLRRLSQQGHFKAKESGKIRRSKRKPYRTDQNPFVRKEILRYLPLSLENVR